MAEQDFAAYTIPPLAYVDAAHIMLFGTSGGAGVNVAAAALVALQSDGRFRADRNYNGTTELVVSNSHVGGVAAARLVLRTGSANMYAQMTVSEDAAYRQIANGAACGTAYDDADTHYVRKADGTIKAVYQSDLVTNFLGARIYVGNYKLLLQHDGSNGYIRAETGNLYLGTTGANRWQITTGELGPTADNAYSICGAGNRATVVYAATGTINTSDAREKAWRGPLTEAELGAARRIAGEIGVYRWLDALAVKGDEARMHIGARAQRVWAIMADECLIDPIGEDGRPGATPYAFLCWDEWGDRYEDEYEDVTVTERVLAGERVSSVLGQDGQPLREPIFADHTRVERRATGNRVLVQAAGDRFGLRVDQLCLFILAAQEQRLAALEAAA